MTLRFYLNDFKLFNLAEKQNLLVEKPTHLLFKNHLTTILFGVAIVSVYSVATSTFIVHLPYYLTIKAGFSHEGSLMILAVAITLVAILTPFFGKLCDKLNPFLIYNAALSGMIMLSPILFYLLSVSDLISIITGIAIYSIITSLISSAIFSILVGSFPFGVRYSGVSLSFNLSVTIFSSSTPVVLILIEKYFDTPYAPGLYISVISLGCLLITGYLRKKLHIESFNEQECESFIYKGN